MIHLSSCPKFLSEDCENITKGVSIIEPDINNNTATDMKVRVTLDVLLELQIYFQRKEQGGLPLFELKCKNGMVVKSLEFLGFVKQSYPRLGRRHLDNRKKQVAKSSTEVTTCSLVSEDD